MTQKLLILACVLLTSWWAAASIESTPILDKASSFQVLEVANQRARHELRVDAATNPVIRPYADVIDQLLVLNRNLIRQAVSGGLIKESQLDSSPQIRALRARLEGKRLLGNTMRDIGTGIKLAGSIVGVVAPVLSLFVG